MMIDVPQTSGRNTFPDVLNNSTSAWLFPQPDCKEAAVPRLTATLVIQVSDGQPKESAAT